MKKTAYVCAPWLSAAYKVGAVLLIAAEVLSLILGISADWSGLGKLLEGKESLEAFLYVMGSVVPDIVTRVLYVTVPVLVYGMIFAYEKFDLRYTASLLIGLYFLGNGWRFSTDLFTAPELILPVLFLISLIGGRWNVSFRVGILRYLATPWFSLLSFVIAALLGIISYGLEDYAGMLTCLGYAVIFFLSQPMPREAIRKDPFFHSCFAGGDCFLLLAAAFVGASFLVSCLTSGKFLFESEVTGSALMGIALVVFAFELMKVLSVRYRNLYWLGLVLLFAVTGSASYGEYSTFFCIYALLILSAIGFSGNRPVVRTGKFDLTLFELVAAVFTALYGLLAVYNLAELTVYLLTNQPHVMTKAYKIRVMDWVLCDVRSVLCCLFVLLTVLSSKTEAGENGVAWFFRTVIGRVKGFAGTFQKDAGKKIQKLAFIASCIFITVSALSAAGFAVSLTAGILVKVSNAFRTLLPDRRYFLWAGYCLGNALVTMVSAVSTWTLYAYGQIAADVHSIPKMLVSRTVYKATRKDGQ